MNDSVSYVKGLVGLLSSVVDRLMVVQQDNGTVTVFHNYVLDLLVLLIELLLIRVLDHYNDLSTDLYKQVVRSILLKIYVVMISFYAVVYVLVNSYFKLNR